MFCLLVSVCILFLVLSQPPVLTSSLSLNNSLLFLGLLSVVAGAAPGSSWESLGVMAVTSVAQLGLCW